MRCQLPRLEERSGLCLIVIELCVVSAREAVVDLFSLALAVIGILLTVVLSDPIIRFVLFCMSKIKRRRWSARQYRAGKVWNLRHFGYEEWNFEGVVDNQGNVRLAFDARIINLSNQLLDSL